MHPWLEALLILNPCPRAFFSMKFPRSGQSRVACFLAHNSQCVNLQDHFMRPVGLHKPPQAWHYPWLGTGMVTWAIRSGLANRHGWHSRAWCPSSVSKHHSSVLLPGCLAPWFLLLAFLWMSMLVLVCVPLKTEFETRKEAVHGQIINAWIDSIWTPVSNHRKIWAYNVLYENKSHVCYRWCWPFQEWPVT